MGFESYNRDNKQVPVTDSPWGEAYQQSVPEFNPGKSQAGELGREKVGRIDIGAEIDVLQDELKKRREEYNRIRNLDYSQRDQRTYGDEFRDALQKSRQAQEDLNVMRMVQSVNSDKSEDETTSVEDATETLRTYIVNCENNAHRIAAERRQYELFSDEYNELTKHHVGLVHNAEAARRVAERLGLDVSESDDDEGQALEDEPQLDVRGDSETEKTPAVDSEPNVETGKEETIDGAGDVSGEMVIGANSEAEVRRIRSEIESIRPDIERLFAMARGSFRTEQAAAYLLTINQKMRDLSARYAAVLQNSKNIGEVQSFVAHYEEEMRRGYGQSNNAIQSIRDKAVVSPISLKGPMLHACQKIENTLGLMMMTIVQKDNDSHETPMGKRKADDRELEEILEEENGMEM